MRKIVVALISLLMGVGPFVVGGIGLGGTALANGLCHPAGTSGMTAFVVATSGEHISGTINASGCGIGVYVGPGVYNVVISGANISGAKYHGIYAQDTFNVTIENNVVSNNEPNGGAFLETKAIQLTGTSNSVVEYNTVDNNGGGGIAVTDDGNFDAVSPGGPVAGLPNPGNNNKIIGNDVENNTSDCGIVVSSYIPGEGVSGNVVSGNTVINNSAGIVIAADAPNTMANNNSVTNNVSNGNEFAGIVVHSNEPGDVVNGTLVESNTVDGNPIPGIGIIVGAEAPGATLSGTVVIANQISNEHIGIATRDVHRLWSFGNRFHHVWRTYGPEPSED